MLDQPLAHAGSGLQIGGRAAGVQLQARLRHHHLFEMQGVGEVGLQQGKGVAFPQQRMEHLGGGILASAVAEQGRQTDQIPG